MYRTVMMCLQNTFLKPHISNAGPRKKMGREGPKWGREVLFPANPDLANILGRTDFDFENFYFWDFLGSQIFGPLDFRAQGPTDFRALGPGP